MSKKKIFITLGIIILLAFLAVNLSYSGYFNLGVDFLNKKFSLNFPHFPEIPFKLGLDLQGGTRLVYEADLLNIEKKDYDFAMQGLRDVIERRVNLFGVQEPMVQTQEAGGVHRLAVELAGIKDPAEAIREIGKTPFLEFREPKENFEEILKKRQELVGKTEEEITQIENWQLALEEPFQSTSLNGRYLKKTEIGFHPTTNEPLVLLQFNDEGAKIFKELTAKWTGRPLAIYVDGILMSAPKVEEEISGGKAQISGRFTIEEAKELARNLNAGALPVPIKLISQKTIEPILGRISLEQSLKAGIFGFVSILIFMILFYRIPGIFASISLLIYVVFLLALFKLIPVTLTLAGIAGFLLSMGMAVDANILIFSRMREELGEKKGYLISLEEGFRRAWPSIRDGNFTTILVGLILFGFGTSFVKGFAFTLIIGNLVGMFAAIFITNNFLRCFAGTRLENWKWLWK